jgi:hypothetical protein
MSGLMFGTIASSRVFASGPFSLTLSSNTSNLDVHQYFLDNGWDGTKEAQLTIDSGVYVYGEGGTNTSSSGIIYDTAFPNGLTIVNNGYILGCGGTFSYNSSNQVIAVEATHGIDVQASGLSIDNQNGYICGGGGQGGMGGATLGVPGTTGTAYGFVYGGGGGGAGGGGSQGVTAAVNERGITPTMTQGLEGSPGQSGGNGTLSGSYAGGGGGGRIVPGTGGASQTPANTSGVAGLGGGSGGSGGKSFQLVSIGGGRFYSRHRLGGGGGGWGASGGNGTYLNIYRFYGPVTTTGAGGSGNSAGGNPTGSSSSYAGRPGANAVKLNGNTVTFINNGIRYGAVS